MEEVLNNAKRLSRDRGQADSNQANGSRVWRSVVAAFFVLALWALTATAQQQASPTVQGTVRDSSGNLVSGASVRLEREGAPPAETKTNDEGAFTFSLVAPGSYSVIAEKTGRRSSAITVVAGQSEIRHVDLIIEETGAASAPSSPAGGMEFSDKPNFTIAAVTDWTAAGGHGSDAVLRTSEALNREALTLKPDATGTRPAESTDEWKQTENALRAALVNAPDSFETNHKLGEFYLHAERYAESLSPLKTAYAIDPANLENEYDFALTLKGSGDLAQARKHVDNLLARNDNAAVQRLAGDLDEKLGDPLAAAHEFERAVREDPSEQNYFEWGSELLLHRAVWQAKDVFSEGVKAYPKSARMLTALGAALFAGALYDEAAQRFCAASDLNPADPEPYIFMGKIETSAPNPLPCVEQKLARFVALRPADSLANYFYAMTIWKQKGQSIDRATLDLVAELLIKAVEIDPKCSEAYLQLGVLQSTRRDYGQAIEFYSKAIDANPQMSEAHYRLGVAYDRVGNKEKAAQQFRLHDEIEKQQAAAIEKQRREVKQFVVLVHGKQAGATPQ